MEIKLLSQITLDGYIARSDGKRDWYLNPAIYGIDDFLKNASALIDYENEKYKIEMKTGEIFIHDNLDFLSEIKEISGYVAIEANICNASLITTLITRCMITELHLIYIPVCLGTGVSLFKSPDNKSEWQLLKMEQIDNSINVRYLFQR